MADSADDTVAQSQYDYLWGRRAAIKLRVLNNRLYHQERQRIFETREGAIKVISILAGSLIFSKLANPDIVLWGAAAVTVSSAVSLVFGFGSKARDSAKRSAEWTLLGRDIEQPGERDFTEVQLASWAARCNEIEVGEPMAHPGLWERCYQRACNSLGQTPIGPATISRWHRHCPPLVIH